MTSGPSAPSHTRTHTFHEMILEERSPLCSWLVSMKPYGSMELCAHERVGWSTAPPPY